MAVRLTWLVRRQLAPACHAVALDRVGPERRPRAACGQQAAGNTREPFVFYAAVALIYLAFTSLSELLFNRLQKRLSIGVRSPMAMSLVKRSPPTARTAV